MKGATKLLIHDIITCGIKNCNDVLNGKTSDCSKVITDQNFTDSSKFQLPEPWNGDIENAEIVFLGPNPGYDENEFYPDLNNIYWTPDTIEDFFQNRFSETTRSVINAPYIKTNTRSYKVLMKDMEYKNYTGFWSYVYKIANGEIYQKYKRDAIIGKDYCITEIVHCKSKTISSLTPSCINNCVSKFLYRTLDAAANMKLLVVVGSQALDIIYKELCKTNPNIQKPTVTSYKYFNNIDLNGRKLNIVFIPHNNCRGVSSKDYFDKTGGLLWKI